jgi:NADH dehydrogenase
MNIVVAGGTGFVGRYITWALLDAGHDVTVLSRNPGRAAAIPQLAGARATDGDVTDPATLAGKLEGADAVVGVAQLPNYPIEVPRKGLTFDRYDRGGTENLIAEAERSSVKHLVYISGAGADSRSDKNWYRAKGRAEDALRASSLRWAIVRPSWAYGREDRALNKFVAISRFSPVVPRIGIRQQRIQPVFIEDVGATVARIVGGTDTWDRVYEIGGPDVLTMEDVIRTMLEVTGRRRLIIPVPKPLAKLGVAPLVLLPKPPMTPDGIEFAAQDGVVDNTELTKTLGIEPIDLRAGLQRYLA